MMPSKIKQEEFVSQIQNAFADTHYPGDDNLIKKPEHWESWKINEVLKSKHWSKLSSEEIFEVRFNLPNFTPEAFRFYLPAYLIASLDDTYGGEIIENVVYSLDPQEDIRQEFFTRIEGLSSEQKETVKKFVKYYVETETIKTVHDERMERFWDNHSI